MTTTATDRPGKGSRVPEPLRQGLAEAFRDSYEAGASIRDIAATHERSYGFVHSLLKGVGTVFRPRGGWHR